jgi:hypothetical protein
MKNRYYTNSELSVYRDCVRKWYLSHYRQIARVHERVSETTETGNGVHYACQHYYNSDGQMDIVALVVEYFALQVAEQQALITDDISDGARAIVEQNIEALGKAEDFAKIMVEGYVEWLEEEGADSYLTFISAEEEVAVEFPAGGFPKDGVEQPYLLAKLDARFQDQRSGARVFMDHKTVQNFADREKWAHLDPQFYLYSLIDYLTLLAEGHEQEEAEALWTDGGIINMLRKVKRTSRATPPFYKRLEVRKSMIELRNYYVRVSGEMTRIQQTELALDAGVDHHMVCPPSPSRDCDWKCSYMQLCAMMDDGSDNEGYIENVMTHRNPLERYITIGGLHGTADIE